MKLRIILGSLVIVSMVTAQNFTVSTATYLGGSSSGDELNACDVAPDGTIVVGGRMPGHNPGGVTPVNLLGGGNGVVIRLNNTGTSVLSITRFGDTIQDLEVGPDGKIAVTWNAGHGLLKADASAFIWYSDTVKIGHLTSHTGAFFADYSSSTINMKYRRSLSRISIGTDGTVASLQIPLNCWKVSPGKPIWYCYVYDSAGTLLKLITGGGYFNKDTCGDTKFVYNGYPEDVCVDGNNHSVIVAGWNPDKTSYSPYTPIHIPFMYAYDYNGNLKWKDYHYTADGCFAVSSTADSRINEIVIGADGYLYQAGYIHGGDHLFARDPKNVNNPALVHTGYDSYSNAYSMGAGIDQAYFCKYDPLTGNILKGQALLVRKNTDGSSTPNQSLIKAIEVDADGRLYLTGYCQLYMKSRSTLQVNGTTVGTVATTFPSPANGSEIFLAIIAPDWNSREVWTSFSLNNAEGSGWGIGVNNLTAALAGEVFTGTMITSSNAIQSTPGSLKDGYLVAWTPTLTNITEPAIPEIKNTSAITCKITGREINLFFPDLFEYDVSLYSTDGRLIYHATGKNSFHKIHSSMLQSGVYLLYARQQDALLNIKIVLQ